jgi:chromosome segregation ATPase
METEQIEKRFSWLDEERRKESDKLNLVKEKLATFEETISTHTKQLKDVSSELTRLAALSTRIHQIDDTLSKHRKEISRQLGDAEERRSQKEKAIENLRKADQKKFAKDFDDLRAELGVVERVQQALDTRREEELRLNQSLDALKKRLEDLEAEQGDRTHQLSMIEEGRKQDSRRVGELQAETTDIRLKTDTLRGELDSTADRIRRLETSNAELVASDNERREAQDLWVDSQNLKMVEFERAWKGWQEIFNEFEKKAAELDERILAYDETYRAMRQLRSDLDDALERLERRINEVTEMQRLAADRLKQEWSSFQANDQKRWNTYKLTTDEQWREHTRLYEKVEAQLQILDENTSDALQMAMDLKDADRQLLLAIIATLRESAAESE